MNQDNNNGFELSGTLGSLNDAALNNLETQSTNDTETNFENKSANPTNEIEQRLDEYFKDNNKLNGSLLKLTKNGKLIYVVSQDNNKILEIIESKETI